jgi:tetratricopeptide (TPR) repeat protein
VKPVFRHPAQAARVAASPAAKQAQAKFNQALALHQRGQLAPARALYLEVLKLQPAHFDALHCMGVLAYQSRDPAAAVVWLDKALALNPRYAPAHNNRGAALKDLAQWDAALASYDRAISLQAGYAEAWNNRAVVLRELGQHQAAIDSYRVAIKHKADYADAWNNLGNVLAQLMQYEAALENYENAVRFKPDHADAWYNRGNTLARLGRYAAAVESHDRAIALKPGHADAFNNRGTALAAMGEHQAAIGNYERTLALRPDHADAHYNRGIALGELHNHAGAIESYVSAIALKPAYAHAWYNQGVALGRLKEHQKAIECYDRAIALGGEFLAEAYNNRGGALAALQQYQAAIDSYEQALACRPDFVDPYYNRGNALGFLQQYQLAIDSYEQAIALQPDHASAWSNRAHALAQLMQHGAALESYGKAIAADPSHAGAQVGLGLSLLQLGEFDRGWKHYEWRWKEEALKKAARNFSQPLWTGAEPLQGKTILLHAEQGFGDTLQFCRYAKVIGALGARVLVEVQPELLGLLEGLDGAAQVLAKGQPLPDFDCHCPLLSLPLALGTTLANLPSGKPYLSAPAHKVVQWTQRLGQKTRPRVGLVWSGNAAHKNDRNRSLALAELVAHLPQTFDYISLQKEFRPDDRHTLEQHPHILRLDQEIGDFTDTAALCALMDVVISVDTSVAHLAGALGRPVWMALPLNPDWRWLLERSDSPWYPSVTLYRQQAAGDWEGVFRRIAAALATLATASPTPLPAKP